MKDSQCYSKGGSSTMTKYQIGRINFTLWIATICFWSFAPRIAQGAEPLKKIRVAFPSIVIDFAPLWIARDKGFFRDERLDVEITYIQGNIRGVQSLLAGEV